VNVPAPVIASRQSLRAMQENQTGRFNKSVLLGGALVLLTSASVNSAIPRGDNITAETLVTRHLESIGSTEARAAIKSRVITGNVTSTIRLGGAGQLAGRAVLASTGSKSLIGMTFNDIKYSNENMAFDGKTVTVGQFTPGTRSPLGQFVLSFDMVFKQGLLGGTLSSAWPLLDLHITNPRLKYAGVKKINNQQLCVLNYYPRDSSFLGITLFFDAETFQHVRTEYEKVVNAGMVTQNEMSAGQQETRYKMIEEFADFKKEGGLSLPHSYKIQLSISNQRGSLLQDWAFTLTQFGFNEVLDDKQFNVAKRP
jgi:hypothetical protein